MARRGAEAARQRRRTEISFAERVTLEVDVALNGLAPRDVRVECQVRRVLGSELDVPVQGYAENRRPKHGVGYLEGEPCSLEPFTPGAVDEAGICRYRLELQPPWAGTLRVRGAGGAATIRTCRIRTSSV